MIFTLADARRIARVAHQGHTDKAGRDMFDHHVAVVANLVHAQAETVQMAAFLHDVVEDSTMTLADLGDQGCPQAVLEAVDALTRRPGERYVDYIARAAAHPVARTVKLADNQVNLANNDLLVDRELAASLRKRYQKARAVLLAAQVTEQPGLETP